MNLFRNSKPLICALLACALAMTNFAHAEEAAAETSRPPRQVSKLEKNRRDARKWAGYALAAGAVIIAVVTLVLVSHHHHDHDHHHNHGHGHKRH